MTSRNKYDALPPKEVAVDLVRRLQDAGHVAYFAGGCVRDQLLGLEPIEYDIATGAVPDELKSLFPGARLVGESFGVVIVQSGGHAVDIATFRSEGVYSDRRHPDEVNFCGEEEDAKRRDFTINGIFHDPISDRYIDYHDGMQDLQNAILRAIGDPEDRFNEDRLRMLRAVRFAARFDLVIDEDTAAAIVRHAGDLEGISRERIGGEIHRMATEGRWVDAVRLMQELQLTTSVLGSLGMSEAVEFWPRCEFLDARVPHPSPDRHQPAVAAWLLDGCSQEQVTPAVLKSVGDRLVSSNHDRAELLGILEVHHRLIEGWMELDISAQKRLAVRDEFASALLLVEAVDSDVASKIQARVAELARTGLAPAPLVRGSDLIEAGFEPGPDFGVILEEVYDAQLEGRISTQPEGINLARDVQQGL